MTTAVTASAAAASGLRVDELLAPAVYTGTTTHVRREPLANRFTYATSLWLVDIDALPTASRYGRIAASDHLHGDGSLRERVTALLAEHDLALDGGRVLLLAHARTAGHVFNPLSLWWCFDTAGDLLAVVAEVHNTYGDRHAYVLPPSTVHAAADVEKSMYVSPFYGADGRYSIRVSMPGEKLAVAITMTPPEGAPFVATLVATRSAMTSRSLRRSLRHSSRRTSLLIRWQGVRLWLRRLPVQPRPAHSDRLPRF